MSLGSIEKFDIREPKQWITYKKRLDCYLSVHNLNPVRTRDLFLTVIGRDAYILVKSLCVPDLPSSKTYDELIVLISRHFGTFWATPVPVPPVPVPKGYAEETFWLTEEITKQESKPIEENVADAGDGDSSIDDSIKEQMAKTEVNVDNEVFVPPTDEEAGKIVKQVESYFTDFSIMKDTFLQKHIRRNKEGHISLKLVASFRRVKAITKDWRIVRHSMMRSKVLNLNKEGTKIKRLEPVPQLEETSCRKTVLVFNLPEDPTAQQVYNLMIPYGETLEITVVRPGGTIPEMCTKHVFTYYEDLITKPFALVEFKSFASFQAAVKAHEHAADDALKIAPLLPDTYKGRDKFSSSSPTDSPWSVSGIQRYRNSKKKVTKSRIRLDEQKSWGSSNSPSENKPLRRNLYQKKSSLACPQHKEPKHSIYGDSPEAASKSEHSSKPSRGSGGGSSPDDHATKRATPPRRVHAKSSNKTLNSLKPSSPKKRKMNSKEKTVIAMQTRSPKKASSSSKKTLTEVTMKELELPNDEVNEDYFTKGYKAGVKHRAHWVRPPEFSSSSQ